MCESHVKGRTPKQVGLALAVALFPNNLIILDFFSFLLKVSDIVTKKIIFKVEPDKRAKGQHIKIYRMQLCQVRPTDLITALKRLKIFSVLRF